MRNLRPARPARLAFWALLACLALSAGRAGACTLWAALGDKADGACLLAKNRDFSPSSTDALYLVRPEKGLAYVGLVATINGRETLVAGVNQAGLAMVSATAGSVPPEERKVASSVKGLLRKALMEASGVDQVLTHMDWFAGHAPVIYMLADPRRAVWIEVGPGGKTAWQEAKNGVLAHTNHYLPGGLEGENIVQPGQSSLARMQRVQALLDGHRGAFTLDDFKKISRDQAAGPDDSIFRTGSTPKKTRTLATFLVHTNAQGDNRAYVAGFDTGMAPWEMNLTLDQTFWDRVKPGERVRLSPATP